MRQRDTQKGFNDVGWDIWPDNYGRFLDQIDADATSVPLAISGTATDLVLDAVADETDSLSDTGTFDDLLDQLRAARIR